MWASRSSWAPGGLGTADAAPPALRAPTCARACPLITACSSSAPLQARVELKVKAVGSNTIARLRERLEPTGFYVHPDPAMDYGDK